MSALLQLHIFMGAKSCEAINFVERKGWFLSMQSRLPFSQKKKKKRRKKERGKREREDESKWNCYCQTHVCSLKSVICCCCLFVVDVAKRALCGDNVWLLQQLSDHGCSALSVTADSRLSKTAQPSLKLCCGLDCCWLFWLASLHRLRFVCTSSAWLLVEGGNHKGDGGGGGGGEGGDRQTETETDKNRDRERQRETDSAIQRQKDSDREKDRTREREGKGEERQTDRQCQRQRDRDTHRGTETERPTETERVRET